MELSVRYSKLISSSETWATLCAAALICSAALLTTGPAFATTPKTILSEGVMRATGGGAGGAFLPFLLVGLARRRRSKHIVCGGQAG